MKRPSLSTTRRPVVLLVQATRGDSLEMYAEFLRYHGLAVITVADAREALMRAPQADVVVTGINLDEPMDGVELVSRLRHDDCTRSTPIVVLTACAWPKDRERAEGAGCDVFLSKPCLPNDLLGEVRQLLTARRSQTAHAPHVFQQSSHRTPRHAQGWRAAHRQSRQWLGHRDGDIKERKQALRGPTRSRPVFTQVSGAQSVGDRDRVRHRPPCVRAIPCPGL